MGEEYGRGGVKMIRVGVAKSNVDRGFYTQYTTSTGGRQEAEDCDVTTPVRIATRRRVEKLLHTSGTASTTSDWMRSSGRSEQNSSPPPRTLAVLDDDSSHESHVHHSTLTLTCQKRGRNTRDPMHVTSQSHTRSGCGS